MARSRYALVFSTRDLGLLLAVNEAPGEWKVGRGEAGAVDRGGSYTERRYGVRFAYNDTQASVPADTWGRMEVEGATYYVWGRAAERTLRPGKRPMPDYVESWADFAIVRAR